MSFKDKLNRLKRRLEEKEAAELKAEDETRAAKQKQINELNTLADRNFRSLLKEVNRTFLNNKGIIHLLSADTSNTYLSSCVELGWKSEYQWHAIGLILDGDGSIFMRVAANTSYGVPLNIQSSNWREEIEDRIISAIESDATGYDPSPY
jgi:hypothetical protein